MSKPENTVIGTLSINLVGLGDALEKMQRLSVAASEARAAFSAIGVGVCNEPQIEVSFTTHHQIGGTTTSVAVTRLLAEQPASASPVMTLILPMELTPTEQRTLADLLRSAVGGTPQDSNCQ